MIVKRAFYERDTVIVAKELLGKLLVHETPEGVTTGKIVETEAYLGPEDKAAHAYGNLRTPRTETQYGPKGHSYIYFIYGMYYCLNVTSGKIAGKPEAILIRALEPVQGIELMTKRRKEKHGKEASLTNGPSKLCMAMGLTRKQNGVDMSAPPLHIDQAQTANRENISKSTRINVDYAGDWKLKPWRFYITDNKFVSKN
jgi:DNA-3-methyladenine glycosylase